MRGQDFGHAENRPAHFGFNRPRNLPLRCLKQSLLEHVRRNGRGASARHFHRCSAFDGTLRGLPAPFELPCIGNFLGVSFGCGCDQLNIAGFWHVVVAALCIIRALELRIIHCNRIRHCLGGQDHNACMPQFRGAKQPHMFV